MPNYSYLRGVYKERKLVNAARAKGLLAFRSAGSHSPIDVCVIDRHRRLVRFIQSKGDNEPDSTKKRLLKELEWLKGEFKVVFEVA